MMIIKKLPNVNINDNFIKMIIVRWEIKLRYYCLGTVSNTLFATYSPMLDHEWKKTHLNRFKVYKLF